MMTLTEAPPVLDTLRATGLTELLPATALRITAMVGIAAGITAEELRTCSAGTAREAAHRQVADEIEWLTACGVTKEVARRANAVPSTVTTAEAASLRARRLRAAALALIASDVTPDELRSSPADTAARKVADNEVADEAERLAARGVTRRAASRAIRERARLSDRRVAAAFVRKYGPAAAGICRQVAATAGDETRGSWLAFAAAAEQLLAERGASSLN